MHRPSLPLSLVLLLAAPVACGPQARPAAAPAAAGGPHGTLQTFTDVGTVAGVALARNAVYLASQSGLLRFPAAGGDPTFLGTRDGLPDNRVYAVAAAPDGTLWVATAGGVARSSGDRFTPAGAALPSVGQPTALLPLEGGGVLLGGAQGVARYDGARWTKLTDRYQVLGFARDGNRVLLATAQSGVVALREGFTAVDEYGLSSGIPDALARAVVPVGDGKFWALLQGATGSRLGYFDGHRWLGYSSPRARDPWVGLLPGRSGAVALVTKGGVYDLVEGAARGDALVATDSGNPDGPRHVDLHPEADAAAPPRAGRGSGGGGGGGNNADAESTSPPPRAVPSSAPPVDATPSGNAAGAPRFALARNAAVQVPADVAAVFGEAQDAFLARESAGVVRASGAHPVAYVAHDLATHQRPLSLATDPHGNVWVVTDQGGAARFDGQHFARATVDDDPAAVPLLFWSRGTVVAAVARVGDNTVRAYRFDDERWQRVFERRIDLGGSGTLEARFLAVDDRGRFWVGVRVVRDGQPHEHGAALIDGNLPSVTQFFTTGRPGAATSGATTAGASASATTGRAGAGRATTARRHRRRRARAVTVFNAPDDLAAIETAPDGVAWFAGISGATRIAPGATGAPPVVTTFSETSGLRGDAANDLAWGPRNQLYVATPEGLGFWDNGRFSFDILGGLEAPHALMLADDLNSVLWGAGPHGVWVFDGAHFRTANEGDTPAPESIRDLAVDGSNRVWFATDTGLTILTQPGNAGIAPEGDTESGGEATGNDAPDSGALGI